MKFEKRTEEEFKSHFIGAITKGSKNNTYKFALARFLLDYCNSPNPNMQVKFSTIAEYFFKYYWLQECKSKLLQGPKNQLPQIIKIIRAEFKEETYPQSYKELKAKESDKIEACVEKITNIAFNDVIHRFQKIGGGERKMFYDYFAKKYNDKADNRKVDPKGGILLNKYAVRFFQENFVSLYKSVILEWVRFLEIRNFGTPHLVRKIEGDCLGARDQKKFFKALKPFVECCFYCSNQLQEGRKTHVDHVIPYDYIGDTELWNMVLSCQKCNCEKLGRLPPNQYIEKLLKRNKDYKTAIDGMQDSLATLNYGEQDVCWHYTNAKRHGYPILENFPKSKTSM